MAGLQPTNDAVAQVVTTPYIRIGGELDVRRLMRRLDALNLANAQQQLFEFR